MTQETLQQSDTQAEKTIWLYADRMMPLISPASQMRLGEGCTRLQTMPELAEYFGLASLYLKHEEENPHGSFKDRSLAYRISYAQQAQEPLLVLSSSGNAAISAAAYCAAAHRNLLVFVSPDTPGGKLAAIAQQAERFPGIHVVLSKRAMRFANYASVHLNAPNIRPSIDDLSLPGYASLGFELAEQLPEGMDHVFSFVTSGSSLLGMGMAWSRLKAAGTAAPGPALHAVQTEGSIASKFDTRRPVGTHEGNLGVKVSRREKAIVALITETQGSGWYILPHELAEMEKMLETAGIHTSWEGAAALAAVKRAAEEKSISGRVVAILSGRNYSAESFDASRFPSIGSLSELDAYLHTHFR